MKRTSAIIICLLLCAAAGAVGGCADKGNQVELLKRCGQAVNDYAQGDGYLHFKQETAYSLETRQGVFNQSVVIEGDSIFPDSQSYEFRETMSSSKMPDKTVSNTFSYLTLEGGKRAFVKGEQLSAQLGVSGWIYYTPPQGQNRYFDLPKFMATITGVDSFVERAGKEEVGGTSCHHLTYTLEGRKVLDLRKQEDPSLEEKLQGFDISGLLRDFQVDIWIGAADSLPRRILMTLELLAEEDIKSSSTYRMELYGWGEEPPVVIERPLSYSEAL